MTPAAVMIYGTRWLSRYSALTWDLLCCISSHELLYGSGFRSRANSIRLSQARGKIAERGRQIGLDFEGEVTALEREADWSAELRAVQDSDLVFPDYYTQPFHAYRDGNLCWEAALQVCTLLVKCPSFQLS